MIRSWAKTQIPVARSDLLAAQICYCPGIVWRMALENLDVTRCQEQAALFQDMAGGRLWEVRLRILKVSLRCVKIALKRNTFLQKRAMHVTKPRKLQVYWQEYYKRWELDDEPFIRRLSEEKINVIRPWNGVPAFIEALKAFVVFNWVYWRNVKRIARMFVRDNGQVPKEQHRLFQKRLIEGLTKDRAINRIAKAYIFDRSVLIRDLRLQTPKVIIMRHVGDPLIGIINRNVKLSSCIYSVILNHSASMSGLPENQNHLLVNFLLLKNESALETVRRWDPDERPEEERMAVVGDPATQQMRSICSRADPSEVTIFLSDAVFWRGLGSLNSKDLKDLSRGIELLEEKGVAVRFRPKGNSLDNTSAVDRAMVDFFSARIATADSFDCILKSGQCYVIPDLVYERISSIAVDCASIGKLDGIILPGNSGLRSGPIFDEVLGRGWASVLIQDFYDTVVGASVNAVNGSECLNANSYSVIGQRTNMGVQRDPTEYLLDIVTSAQLPFR